MKNKSNILLISPVGKHGGRELEVGFIASVLSRKGIVHVVSLSNYYKDSQVLYFSGFEYTSVQKLLLKQSRLYRTILPLFLSKKRTDDNILSSPKLKRLLGIEKRKLKVLKKEINASSTVLFCAQLSTNYLSELIPYAKKQGKKILFRTTGTIFENELLSQVSWLEDVFMYIHHSKKNASTLQKYTASPFVIIDQCAFNETQLLDIPISENLARRFLVVARLSTEKNVVNIIKAFKKIDRSDITLTIVGTGPEEETLKRLAGGFKGITFRGHVPFSQLYEIYAQHDCLIISSTEEAGPLNGIEAMASGLTIISTKVGAMPERLLDNGIWYDGTVNDFIEKVNNLCAMSILEVKKQKEYGRLRYISAYSIEKVSQKYLNCLNQIEPNNS